MQIVSELFKHGYAFLAARFRVFAAALFFQHIYDWLYAFCGGLLSNNLITVAGTGK
jgi:hypothetical protein